MDGEAVDVKLLPVIGRRKLSIRATMTAPKGKTLVIEKQTSSITNEGVKAVTVTLAGKAVSIAAGETVSAKIA